MPIPFPPSNGSAVPIIGQPCKILAAQPQIVWVCQCTPDQVRFSNGLEPAICPHCKKVYAIVHMHYERGQMTITFNHVGYASADAAASPVSPPAVAES